MERHIVISLIIPTITAQLMTIETINTNTAIRKSIIDGHLLAVDDLDVVQSGGGPGRSASRSSGGPGQRLVRVLPAPVVDPGGGVWDPNATLPILPGHGPLEAQGHLPDQVVPRPELVPGPDCRLPVPPTGVGRPKRFETLRLPVGSGLPLLGPPFFRRGLRPLGGFRGFFFFWSL